MRIIMKSVASIVGLFIIFVVYSPSAHAALSTSCSNPTFVVADGRLTEFTIPANSTVWFEFLPTPGHSYTAEGNYEEDPGTNPTVAAFNRADLNTATCAGTSTLGAIDTYAVDPDAEGGDRASFIIPSSATSPAVLISAHNSDGVTHRFTFVVSETTLFNPLWSTFGGFQTFYRFHNTTNATIHVTLTMTDDNGTVVANATITIGPGATAPTRNTAASDLNVTPNDAGHSVITTDAPPGALQVDGFLGNFSSGSVVLPIKIIGARTRL
jgi:hypothetical protein